MLYGFLKGMSHFLSLLPYKFVVRLGRNCGKLYWHWRGGQISGIRHGNKHRCCHAERFRHDVTAEKCHGLPLLQICGFASARQTARMAGSVRSQALTVLAAKG